MIHKKLLSLLALLMTAATGAWAEDYLYLVISGTSATMEYGADKGSNPYYSTDEHGNWGWYVSENERYDGLSSLTTVTIDASCQDYVGTSLAYLFNYWQELATINNIENLNTSSSVTDMSRMFAVCKALTSLDLSGLNTSSVTDMREMFNGSLMETLDLSGWNTSKVTDMSFMFYYCTNLKNIYVGDGWSIDEVTQGNYMFDKCTSLPGYDAGNVTYAMAKMTTDGGYLSVKPDVVVTTDATKTQATFDMPAFDATVDYELVRDMEQSVTVTLASRIRIKEKQSGGYELADGQSITPTLTDDLSDDPVEMTEVSNGVGDYTLQLQKQGDDGKWTDIQDTDLSEGVFRYVITGANLYDGELTKEFRLVTGYSVRVDAGKYATFYGDEAVTVDSSTPDGQLYTISSVSGDEAELSSAITTAPAETPLLVYNSSTVAKNIILIPVEEDEADEVTAYEGFKGTSEDKAVNADGYGPWKFDDDMKYYGFNGTDFIWIKTAGSVAAHRCWLELGTGNNARTVTLGTGTTEVRNVNDDDDDSGVWHDLSGRKLNRKPTRKGVYIVGGQKRTVK